MAEAKSGGRKGKADKAGGSKSGLAHQAEVRWQAGREVASLQRWSQKAQGQVMSQLERSMACTPWKRCCAIIPSASSRYGWPKAGATRVCRC